MVDHIGGLAALPTLDDGDAPLMLTEIGHPCLVPCMVITALASRRAALIGFGLSLTSAGAKLPMSDDTAAGAYPRGAGWHDLTPPASGRA